MDELLPPAVATLLFQGGDALPAFRRERLIERARDVHPSIRSVGGRWVYFVRVGDAATSVLDPLGRLLDASLVEPARAAAMLDCGIVVMPRLGTVSPWSSRATDIARNCGFEAVSRIERGILWSVTHAGSARHDSLRMLATSGLLHDRMTQRALFPRGSAGSEADPEAHLPDAGVEALFVRGPPVSHSTVPLRANGSARLVEVNHALGLGLEQRELEYLRTRFSDLGRDPTDAELMMFAQVNSEHCRHKIFNATWTIDGIERERSLFEMIRHTHACHPGDVLSAYRDNAAVMRGNDASWFVPDRDSGRYSTEPGRVDILMKVETHNHPTAISPFPGAATGSGGEIRDEAATGRGARSKAGITGFSVSNLRIPGFVQPWEHDVGRPAHIASALEIMLEGPIGAAAFGNEFGRPALGGFFRTLELDPARLGAADATRIPRSYGYHKPIMVAGGVGSIRADQVQKSDFPPGARVVVLGGPAMLIGLGGGAASSSASGSGDEDLDFASVQRENPEMQRRCQEVIDRCWQLGTDNPILSIHDVGAGGLSNALPELVDSSRRGGRFELRAIPCDDPAMSPLEIWCNESQERYVLAIAADRLADFAALCERERCPWADVGEATRDRVLEVHDDEFDAVPVSMPMSVLLGDLPRMHRDTVRAPCASGELDTQEIRIEAGLERVLRMPAVADKSFLVTIGDRTVGGLVARDQMTRPLAGPGGGLRGHAQRLPRPHRRGDGDGGSAPRSRYSIRGPLREWR